MKSAVKLSVVVPVYNESAGIVEFHGQLTAAVKSLVRSEYEILYCNDGSTDNTIDLLRDLAAKESRCRVISLSRNFGKEYAVAAGLRAARGSAVVLMDGDGQHPIASLPDFYKAWESGTQVVVGRRTDEDVESFGKKIVSKLFYACYNVATGNKLDPLATDYRLMDREVVDAYCNLTETDRLNRFLIDWLGFTRDTVAIDRHERIAGTSKFTVSALIRLGVDTLISSSVRPLYALLVVGVVIASGSLLLGITVGIEQFVLNDPLGWKFTGTALLSVMILFLVGLLLVSQGIVSLYIAASYRQAKRRPLYIVNKQLSYNIDEHVGNENTF